MTGRKMTAGNSKPFEPTNINDMTNVKSLDYNKPYTEFNYDKYISHYKQSNFVGGNKKKTGNKMNHLIKNMYIDYKKGKSSNMKKMRNSNQMRGGAADDMFLSTMKEMKDLSHLDYQEPYQYREMSTISKMPRSNFQSLASWSN